MPEPGDGDATTPPDRLRRPGRPGRPAAFLDRDGTIIVERDYLADPAGVELLPGAVDGLKALRKAGFALVVVTNQSGIARGLYDLAAFRAVQRRLEELLAAEGIQLDGVYLCPHHPDFTGPCDCRKPATGLYLRAAAELGLDPAASLFIGDKPSDVDPAAALGGTALLVRTGYGAETERGLRAAGDAAPDAPATDRSVASSPSVLADLGAVSGWLASTRWRGCGAEFGTSRPD